MRSGHRGPELVEGPIPLKSRMKKESGHRCTDRNRYQRLQGERLVLGSPFSGGEPERPHVDACHGIPTVPTVPNVP